MATCKSVLSHCYLGDWFVLYQLSKNSNSYFFRYLLKLMDTSFTSQVDGYLSTDKSSQDIIQFFLQAKSRYFSVARLSFQKNGEEHRKRKQTLNGHNVDDDTAI